MVEFYCAAKSDVGCKRTLNEDSFIAREDIKLWAVADGAGGMDAGDVASRMVIERFRGLGSFLGGKSYLQDVEAAIRGANDDIRAYSDAHLGGRAMGSTVVCMISVRDFAALLWVGDSRIYRVRGGMMEQVTRDHSLVQQLVDAGEISAAEAAIHPQKNVITRAVGAAVGIDIDVTRFRIEPGDRFLLCSDGLTDAVPEGQIAEMMRAADVDQGAERLLDAALANGAKDNVTFLALEAR